MFEGQETFAIGNYSIKRCSVHREKNFVLAKEIKVVKNLESLIYDGKVLTIGAIILSK